MRRVDRYLLSQLLVPFGIGLFTFSVIMLGDVARQLGSLLMGSHLSPLLLAQYLACHAPHALSWSMPVGAVVGVALTITLLANGGEITAMRAGGCSFPRLCRPIILVGLLASLLSFALGEYAAPPASRRARELFAQIGLAQPVMTQQYDVFFHDEQGRRLIHVGHMNPKTNELEQVTLWQQDDQGRLSAITTARWAEVRDRNWFLREGASVQLNPAGEQQGPVERFREKQITLWRALQDYYASTRGHHEMSTTELRDTIGTLATSGAETHKLAVQYHFKYSIPLACLLFALIAAPIAFRCARYGSFVGVVIAILVVFLYNGVRSWTLAFGLAGALAPFWAGWIPTILFGLVGLALLAHSRRW